MKYFVFCMLIILCGVISKAQINITPTISENITNNHPDASNIFITKLYSILSANDIHSEMGESRFVLAGNWLPESKDIVSSAPPQIAYTLNVHLSIEDVVVGTKYVSETFRVKGVGNTDDKACIAAIRKLNVKNDRLNKFITEGKNRIIKYYEDNKDNILANIETLIKKEDYNEAIYQLCLIPMECSYFQDLQNKISQVYQKIIDDQAQPLFSQAKALWASSQSEEGAKSVINLISQIEPNASCYPEVQRFINEINTKVNIIHEHAYQTYQKNLPIGKKWTGSS